MCLYDNLQYKIMSVSDIVINSVLMVSLSWEIMVFDKVVGDG